MDSMRQLECQGVDWMTVGGPELMRHCLRGGKKRWNLRRALIHTFMTAEAKRRWPEFWMTPKGKFQSKFRLVDIDRAEQKEAKKRKKGEFKELLRKQMSDNKALLQQLVGAGR